MFINYRSLILLLIAFRNSEEDFDGGVRIKSLNRAYTEVVIVYIDILNWRR